MLRSRAAREIAATAALDFARISTEPFGPRVRVRSVASRTAVMYLPTVLDDYSRHITALKLCTPTRAEDVTDTLELALATSGCDQGPTSDTNRACCRTTDPAISPANWQRSGTASEGDLLGIKSRIPGAGVVAADQCGSLSDHHLRWLPDLFLFGLGNRNWKCRHPNLLNHNNHSLQAQLQSRSAAQP